MDKLLIYLTCLLALTMANSLAVSAQEINGTMDAAASNTTMNNTTIDDTANNASIPAEATESSNIIPTNLSSGKEQPQNLSTAQSSITAPISQMALPAPLVAARASSIQSAVPQEGSQEIGTVVKDANHTIPDPSQMDPLELSLPSKPIKDVGTIFFVCDLV